MEQLDKALQQDSSAASASAPPPLSDAIARLMAQPELLSMVASALGAPAPSAAQEGVGSGREEASQSAEPALSVPATVPDQKEASSAPADAAPASANASLPDMIATLAPLLGGKAGGISAGKDDDRTCLLRALKPYVNPGRREAIDYMIRLSRISDTLKHLT